MMTFGTLSSPGWTWTSSDDYQNTISDESFGPTKFEEVTNLLLENPNLNSSHLFRADILFDSSGELKTKAEKEGQLTAQSVVQQTDTSNVEADGAKFAYNPPPVIQSISPERTVVRKLIPRNQNLDEAIQQSCFFYALENHAKAVVSIPHITDAERMPWYHPKVRALAYLYEPSSGTDRSSLSIHFAPFNEDKDGEIPSRLHRTVVSLLSTFIRLARHNSEPEPSTKSPNVTPSSAADLDLRPSAIKDTIIPQHTVQDTYARLKTAYATKLIAAWVEATPPEKHVFEDLSIAAFLVCLWQELYGSPSRFPGFVDFACGNGLLVHILLQEGWSGIGLDARRRKTWASLGLENNIQEKTIIPRPFLEKLDYITNTDGSLHLNDDRNTPIHNGIFPPGTFIIANHADELTVWMPILAALSCPSVPLPFLNIPCCSHALSGERHRYTPKDAALAAVSTPSTPSISSSTASAPTAHDDKPPQTHEDHLKLNNHELQPSQGSLKSLRAERTTSTATNDDKSMYACLTRKAVQISRDLGLEVTCTLMRIPSTRNIGIVHRNMPKPAEELGDKDSDAHSDAHSEEGSEVNHDEEARATWRKERIEEIVHRECQRSGGLQRSAEVWAERARRVHVGGGRGKVNLGGPRAA